MVLPLDLDKQRGTRICKNIISYFYPPAVTFVWSWRGIGESSRTRRRVESRNCKRELTSAKILDLILSQNSHATNMATPLHTRNACFSLVTAYTHAILVFFFSGHSLHPRNTCFFFFSGHGLHPRIACFPAITLLILSTAGCIGQQHGFIAGQEDILYCYHRLIDWF